MKRATFLKQLAGTIAAAVVGTKVVQALPDNKQDSEISGSAYRRPRRGEIGKIEFPKDKELNEQAKYITWYCTYAGITTEFTDVDNPNNKIYAHRRSIGELLMWYPIASAVEESKL